MDDALYRPIDPKNPSRIVEHSHEDSGVAQDTWDVVQLLAGPNRGALIAEVPADVGNLPNHYRDSWERILTGDSL